MLADDTSLAEPIDGGPDVPFQSHGGATEEDGIGDWSPVRQLVHGKVAVGSYDFKSGRPVVTSAATLNRQGAVPVIESYEYTGAFGFRNLADGDALAKLRMEEAEARGKLFEGGGNNRQLMPGRWFRLTGHFDDDGEDDANEFLVVECTHHATNNYQTKSGAAQYHNRVSCLRRNPVAAGARLPLQRDKDLRHPDGHRRRAGRRGDPHGRIRPRARAIPLGPRGPQR